MKDVLATSWNQAIRIEMRVAEICRQQEIHGWLFDIEKAFEHRSSLINQRMAIDSEISPMLPWFPEDYVTRTIESPFTAKGELAVRVRNYFQDSSEYVAGPFSKVGWHRMNLGSDKQVKDYLMSIGWEPDEWNFNAQTGERTSPKLTEESLSKIDHPLGRHISQRMVIDHRLGLVEGFLKVVRADDRIPSEINTMGTPTGRGTHRKIVNLPKADGKVFFGNEIRELFIVPQGYKLVGCDGEGMQMRMLASRMNSKQFTDELLSGDVHQANFDVCKDLFGTRAIAKTIIYALIFGAGDEKLGKSAGYSGTKKQVSAIGAEIRFRLMKRMPAFDKLIKEAQAWHNKYGFLIGLDGRKLYTRSAHSALNTWLQSDEAVTMKVAMTYLDMWIKKYKLDCHQVTWQHDEFQLETLIRDVDKAMELSAQSIVKAGQELKLNIPMAGNSKAGDNWRETH